MSQHEHDRRDEQQVAVLVSQYEEMLLNDAIGFFEQSSFKCIIDYYEQNAQDERALVVIEHAIAQHAFSAMFYIRKAQLLFEQDKGQEALACLEKAEMFDASDIDIYLLRSEIYAWLEDYTKALQILNTAKASADQSELVEIFLTEANIYEDLHLHKRVFDIISEVLTLQPLNEEALDRIWTATEITEQYKKCIKVHDELLTENAYSYLAWYNIGQAHMAMEAYEKAVEAFEFTYLIQENFEAGYSACIEALLKLERYEAAIQCCHKALGVVGSVSSWYVNLGKCYELNEDFFRAKDICLKAIKLDPYNGEAYFRLGECYSKEEQWQSALGAYQKAIQVDASKAEYPAALAELYFQIYDYEKAIELFQRAINVNPTVSTIWVQYVSFLLEIGEFDSALEVLMEADEFINGTELLYCKVACLFLIGQRKEALNLLHLALEDNYNMHYSLFQLMPDLEYDPQILAAIASYNADYAD